MQFPIRLKIQSRTILFTIMGIFVLILLLVLGRGEMLREGVGPVGGVQEQENWHQVLHIFDGDTFSVRIDGKMETVRVIGIDSPETGEKYRKKECYGKDATNKAMEILDGERVRLESDPSQKNRDKYGRLLRYVYLEDGTFFNLRMIEEGFAEEYTFQDSPYQHQAEFLRAQEKAKEGKKGLWGSCVD
ncbi:MAG: thermonuclease family protein [Patescibacteria group bacterium]|nr:thermonuclease family protein [Patescibacteria group bacterium]